MGSFCCKLSLMIVCIIWSFFLYEGYLAKAPNVALGKCTMQSSTYLNNSDEYGPQIVNDGNRQQTIPDRPEVVEGICAHTFEPPIANEWWVVDLGAIFYIYNIIIFGRADCCVNGRFQDFDVDVIAPTRLTGGLTFKTIDLGLVTFQRHIQFPITHTDIDCPDKTQGQFVRLRHRGTRIFTICEVEVYGKQSTCLEASDVSSHHGFQGRRYEGEAIETLSVNSAIQCMAICKNVHCCYAANFNIKTRQCDMRKKGKCADKDGLVIDKDWNVVHLY